MPNYHGNCYVCKVNSKLIRTKLTCADCKEPICENHSKEDYEIVMFGMGRDVRRCLGCRAKKKQEEANNER